MYSLAEGACACADMVQLFRTFKFFSVWAAPAGPTNKLSVPQPGQPEGPTSSNSQSVWAPPTTWPHTTTTSPLPSPANARHVPSLALVPALPIKPWQKWPRARSPTLRHKAPTRPMPLGQKTPKRPMPSTPPTKPATQSRSTVEQRDFFLARPEPLGQSGGLQHDRPVHRHKRATYQYRAQSQTMKGNTTVCSSDGLYIETLGHHSVEN